MWTGLPTTLAETAMKKVPYTLDVYEKYSKNTCTYTETPCGNGKIDTDVISNEYGSDAEECDDGNNNDND